ncbi:MAG: hypothetical protein ACRD3O_23455 [Terriglobia bacterium]
MVTSAQQIINLMDSRVTGSGEDAKGIAAIVNGSTGVDFRRPP